VRRTQWALWMHHVGRRKWGELELERQLVVLRLNPAERASAMAIGLIAKLRGGSDKGGDFRHCSGCEWLVALGLRPDVWDEFLARSPTPVIGKLGPIDAAIVPFGLEPPIGYDYGHTLTLSYEIFVRRADYEAARLESNQGSWRFHTAVQS
jgi:hypothetical protein